MFVQPERDTLLEMMRRMLLIRRFDERVEELSEAGEIVGPVHLYFGEEAVAVGTCVALRNDDFVTGNHRSHGHPIAKGSAINRIMAELYGKTTGICRGKGGSMHLADFGVGQLGESGVVGSAIPIAVGAALGSKLQNTGRIVVSFFGDGALGQGILYESMNLASIWKLPVVFVCENNGYAVSSHISTTIAAASEKVANLSHPFQIPGVQVDGQDVVAVYAAVSTAAERARAGEGPSFIEAVTYRYSEHAIGLGRAMWKHYRTEDEIAQWQSRDPVRLFQARLASDGLLPAVEFDRMDQQIKSEVAAAVEFARESPEPEPEELYTDMYSTEDLKVTQYQ
jgi:pyruvate dehydrogenase E1 component alpha subunit